jgi:hypothetical protein
MIDWNEDNFLEKLTPKLRKESGGAMGPCPDAETLCAVIEGVARGPGRDAVIEHVSQCAACAELRARLLDFENFESVSPPEPEAEWKQTRTRLDNWLEGFLRSEAAHSRSPKGGRPSRRVFGWENISNLFTPRKIVWAFGVAVALVLIVDGVLLLEYRRAQLHQVQVAVRATVPPQPPPNPALSSAPPGHNLPTETAQAGVSSPPNLTPRVVARPAAPASSRPMASPRTGATPPAAENLLAPPSPPRNGALAPATSHPPALRLDPAGRLLIVLSSINAKPDESFQFHGILLLPVPQPGEVPLDRGAEVIGAGTMSQGQASLAVTELVVQGARFTLKDGTGAMKAQTPGAGGAVQFDRSQVVEMWPASPSVYEKAPDTTAQPEPQK